VAQVKAFQLHKHSSERVTGRAPWCKQQTAGFFPRITVGGWILFVLRQMF